MYVRGIDKIGAESSLAEADCYLQEPAGALVSVMESLSRCADIWR
jgi:hypothetical protein